MTTKHAGIRMTLAGDEYIIPPVTLGVLERMKDQIAKFNGDVMDSAQVTAVIDLAHAALLRNYPSMTRESVCDLIDVGNMADVFGAIMDVSGIKRKAQESERLGEAAQPVTPQTSSPLSVETPAGRGTTLETV